MVPPAPAGEAAVARRGRGRARGGEWGRVTVVRGPRAEGSGEGGRPCRGLLGAGSRPRGRGHVLWGGGEPCEAAGPCFVARGWIVRELFARPPV